MGVRMPVAIAEIGLDSGIAKDRQQIEMGDVAFGQEGGYLDLEAPLRRREFFQIDMRGWIGDAGMKDTFLGRAAGPENARRRQPLVPP